MKYQVELDKDKDIELRRMFFWDAVNKKRLSVFETNYTLASPGRPYKMEPKTVYLMVWKYRLFVVSTTFIFTGLTAV